MTLPTEPSSADIDRYEVLHCNSLNVLKQQVASSLAAGWVLQGGIACTPEGYFQAIASSTERLKGFARLRD